MASKVHRSLESCITEAEELRRNLFTEEEIKLIYQKRSQVEYNVNKRTKLLSDYKACIEFEQMLLKMVRLRRLRTKNSNKKRNIDYFILKRIKKFYNAATTKFSSDFELHVEYFKFGLQSNFHGILPGLLMKMIRNFGHKTEVWKIASGFYAYERKDLNEALKMLYQGLMRLPEAKELYLEAFKLEFLKLKHMESKKSVSENANEKEICKKKLMNYVKLMFENINDREFYNTILKLLEKHHFSEDIQSMIENKLKEMHTDELS